MGVPAYTLVVVFMGALSATAAVGAVALTLGQLTPRRRPGRPRPVRSPMAFEPQPPTGAERLETEPASSPAEPPAQLVAREPIRRLDLALISGRAPERLRMPVELARERILELSLPILLANAGETELEDVSVHVILPNEIAYRASLERMARQGASDVAGATVRYTLSETQTHIRIDVPRLAPGVMVTLPAPIAIKHAADATYPIVMAAVARGLDPVERCYRLELTDPAAAVPEIPTEAWVCRPDEAARQRDPHLPLDRISSMQFVVHEPAAPGAVEQAAYETASI